MADISVEKKILIGVILAFLLAACVVMCIRQTEFEGVSQKDNHLKTGTVELNLNDGIPLLQENECFFYPGMTLQKTIFLENTGSDSVYYRLYFEDISGVLSDHLIVTIKDGDKTLYSSTVSTMTEKSATAVSEQLAPAQRKKLTVFFLLPEDCPEDLEKQRLHFTLCAEAVQTKNNPNIDFG